MGNFAQVFKELRTKSKLTQQEMADKLKISRSSIGMYESGEREPSFELLELIADYFNVDMNYLLGKKESSEHIPQGYYLNDETRYIAQEIFENPDLKSLFDMSRKMPPERLKAHIDFMKNLYNQETGQDI